MLRSKLIAFVLAAVCSAVTLTVVAQQSSTVRYVYDSNGRLHAVILPSGEASIYEYDAAGNLVSIWRQAPTQTQVLGFSPTEGAVGATVTIFGTGFSPVASENVVAFNGVVAVVSAASVTEIVTSVPQGATTGLVSVSAPLGSATSSEPFTVNESENGAPTITGFTPRIGIAGTSVNITGTNFGTDPSDVDVAVNGFPWSVTAATPTQVTARVITRKTSGRIIVNTPAGEARSSDDFFIPPTPYSPSQVVAAARTNFGESKTVTFNGYGVALFVFDGTAGQRASLLTRDVTILSSRISLYEPSGTRLLFRSQGTAGTFFEPFQLPSTGTYTIAIDSPSGYTGDVTLALHDVQDINRTSAVDGPPLTVAFNVPGQVARVTFNGTAGQRVGIQLSDITVSSADVFVRKPDGNPLTGTGFFSTSAEFIETPILPASGVYTILLDPVGAAGGDITVLLRSIQDVTGTIVVDGPPVSVTTTAPGQNARITFTGTAGQRVGLFLSDVTIPDSFVIILTPDGVPVGGSRVLPPDGFVDMSELPVTGTYTIFIDPAYESVGSLTLSLKSIQDITGTITIDGPPVTITTTVAGQNARLTFDATAGQRLNLSLSAVTIPASQVFILDPGGSIVVWTSIDTNGGTLSTEPLAATGTYTILVDPQSADIGSMTFTLTETQDFIGTFQLGGPPVTVNLVARQNARMTMSGIAGQRVVLRLNGFPIPDSYVSVFKPDGALLTEDIYVSGTEEVVDIQTLPSSGSYTFVIRPFWDYIFEGTATITLRAAVTGAMNINGAETNVVVTIPEQTAQLTFAGTSGQTVSLNIYESQFEGVVSIRKPDGTLLATTQIGGAVAAAAQPGQVSASSQTQSALTSEMFSGGIYNVRLPQTGTYTIVVDPNGLSTGRLTLRLSGGGGGSGAID